MSNAPGNQVKSSNEKAFEHYLRTGQRFTAAEWEQKFNPYHDPDNGRFTFGPGGATSGPSTAALGSKPKPGAVRYPVRITLPSSKPAPTPEQQQTVRFRHSAGLDLPQPVIAKANALSDSVRLRTGHEIHVTSGRRAADRQAAAMYDNYLDRTPPSYRNKAAESEVKRVYDNGRKAGLSRESIVHRMTTVLHDQTKRGIYLSAHMRSGAIDIRTPPASALRAIRIHPTVKSVYTENDHIHIQFR